jgi:hypothetical protein
MVNIQCTVFSYYRARYYETNTGRFLTEDPIGFKAGINFYRYVHNDPQQYVDPLGQSILCPSWMPGCPDYYKHKQLLSNAKTDIWIRDMVAVQALDPFCYGKPGVPQLVDIWQLEKINVFIDAVELGDAGIETLKAIPGLQIPESLDVGQVYEFLLTIRDRNNDQIDQLVGDASDAQTCSRCRFRK